MNLQTYFIKPQINLQELSQLWMQKFFHIFQAISNPLQNNQVFYSENEAFPLLWIC